MEITIRELISKFIPGKELKQRLKNNQIKINNEIVTDLSLLLNIHIDSEMELGDFLFKNHYRCKLFQFIDIKDFFGDFDTNIHNVLFLGAYTLISLSKKEHYVYLKDLSKGNFLVEEMSEESEIKYLNQSIIESNELYHYITEKEKNYGK